MRSYLAHLVVRGIRAVPHTAAPGKVLHIAAAALLAAAVSLAHADDREYDDPLIEVTQLMGAGAFDEALQRIDEVLAAEPLPGTAAEALYMRGACHEAMDDLEGAIDAYDQLLADYDWDFWADEARFRRGIDLYLLGEPRAALADLRYLARRTDGEPSPVVQLQIGACHEALGRPRRAVRLTVDALENLELDPREQDTWYRAQGHVVLGALLVRASEGVSLQVRRSDAQRERLKQRWELLQQAEGHFRQAGDLGQPLWTCAAGVQLGEAYERFREAILAAPPPRGLNEEQAGVYAAELEATTARYQHNAAAIYRDVLSFAATAGVDNPWTERARKRLEQIDTAPLFD